MALGWINPRDIRTPWHETWQDDVALASSVNRFESLQTAVGRPFFTVRASRHTVDLTAIADSPVEWVVATRLVANDLVRTAVSVIRAGRAQFVRGTERIGSHFVGRGVDIVTVDGEPVALGSVAPRAFAQEIGRLVQGRPDEVLTPWPDLVGPPGFGNNADHRDHIQVGWTR